MLCIIFISFYSISFCLFNYNLMLWVIMFWGYMVCSTYYVLADGIAVILFHKYRLSAKDQKVADVIIFEFLCNKQVLIVVVWIEVIKGGLQEGSGIPCSCHNLSFWILGAVVVFTLSYFCRSACHGYSCWVVLLMHESFDIEVPCMHKNVPRCCGCLADLPLLQ